MKLLVDDMGGRSRDVPFVAQLPRLALFYAAHRHVQVSISKFDFTFVNADGESRKVVISEFLTRERVLWRRICIGEASP